MAPGSYEAPPLKWVSLTLDRVFLKDLHLSLAREGRRQDAETLRKHVTSHTNSASKMEVRKIEMGSNSTPYQEIQSLFESMLGDCEFASSVGAAGRTLIREVEDDDFPLSFEPSEYGINAMALEKWNGYSDEFAQIQDQRANPAKRSRSTYENAWEGSPSPNLYVHPAVKSKSRTMDWVVNQEHADSVRSER
ncbi:hypothetical protein HDK90DRAFT_493432 [Phyllosticta capitalensis]|uniref:Uncharacterized protein n=2 Tax=Phyllosticta capitalensis TaxID=121624 RepID=A0ABR1YGR6_9PEZI